jgi:hypothetical protein
VLPAITEVVLVQEALSDAQSEINQLHSVRIVAKADAAKVADAVLTTVNDESIEMLVSPTQGQLQCGVQSGDGCIATNEQAPPDQGADATQDDAQLVHAGS